MCFTQKEKPLVTKEVSTLHAPTCPFHPEVELIRGYGNDLALICTQCERGILERKS